MWHAAHAERALEWEEHRFLRRGGLLCCVEDLHGHLFWVGVAPPNEHGALAAGLAERGQTLLTDANRVAFTSFVLAESPDLIFLFPSRRWHAACRARGMARPAAR